MNLKNKRTKGRKGGGVVLPKLRTNIQGGKGRNRLFIDYFLQKRLLSCAPPRTGMEEKKVSTPVQGKGREDIAPMPACSWGGKKK